MAILLQGTSYTRTFKMIDKYDHFSLRTSAGPVVLISKAGGAFNVLDGTVNDAAGNGWYRIFLTAVDTNTKGDLAFYISGTNSDDTDFVDQVSPCIWICGGTVGYVTNAFVSGGTVGTVTGSVLGTVTGGTIGLVRSLLSGTVGKVTFPVTVGTSLDKTGYSLTAGQLFVKKNTALAGFSFPMTDSADHVTLKTGLTVAGTVSIDGGVFAALTNAVSEIGTTGIYKVDLAAADLNGAVIMLKFTSTGADTRLIEIITQT